MKTVLRHRTTGKAFVQVTNDVARDSRLSYGARGVLLAMLSRPADWTHAADRIAAGSPSDGRRPVMRYLRELEAVGYLYRYRTRDGNLVRTVTVVSDEPLSEQQWAELTGSTDTAPPVGSTDTAPPVGSTDFGTPGAGTADSGTSYERQRTKDRDEPPPPGAQGTDRAREAGGRKDEPHPHEPNARRALTTLRTERKLPITDAQLLDLAYEAGAGNPWDGYHAVKTATAASLDGSRNPIAVLRKRLGLGQEHRP